MAGGTPPGAGAVAEGPGSGERERKGGPAVLLQVHGAGVAALFGSMDGWCQSCDNGMEGVLCASAAQ